MKRSVLTLAAVAAGLVGLAAPVQGGEQILLQSGVDPVHALPGPPCCIPMATDPFTPAQLANVVYMPLAVQIAPDPAWIPSLEGYPGAKWIAPQPPTHLLPAPGWVGSALYAVEFEVTTPGDPTGVLELAWAVDDALGDPDGPNYGGVYLNGEPLPAFFCGPSIPLGGHVQCFALEHDVQFLTGTNVLVLYQRDVFGDESGLMFDANITIGLGGSVLYTCQGPVNSTGYRGRIGALGCLDVHHQDTVLLTWNLPAGFGLFVYGKGGVQYPFGNGLLCINPYEPGLFRMSQAQPVSAAGLCSCPLDFGALPAGGVITAGSTWTFQFVYRDVPSGVGYFSLTDALSVTFCE